MEAVRKEAAAPPPIPFPWKRALPGLVLCALALTAVCVAVFFGPRPQIVHGAPAPAIFTRLMSGLGGLLSAANSGGLGWIILALLLTFASVTLSLRLTGRRV